MSLRLPALALAGALTLSGCERGPIFESEKIPALTGSVITEINTILSDPEMRDIHTLLKSIGNTTNCSVVTRGTADGNLSVVLCQTGPLPGRPGGLIAQTTPLPTTTLIGADNYLTALSVRLQDGELIAGTECGVYEDNTREKIGLSPAPHCKEFNKDIDNLVRESDRLLDEAFRSGPTI